VNADRGSRLRGCLVNPVAVKRWLAGDSTASVVIGTLVQSTRADMLILFAKSSAKPTLPMLVQSLRSTDAGR